MEIPISFLWLLLMLLGVDSQPPLNVTFLGQTLPDHAFVDINDVGNNNDGSDSVQCLTGSARNRGWNFPNGTRLPESNENGLYQQRLENQTDLRQNGNAIVSGMYSCEVRVGLEMRGVFYVGLYTNGGGNISLSISVDSGSSLPFTITCVSTGGPVTTVTWTRDSTTVTEGTESVLVNAVAARYIHTLTASTGGNYTCTVANSAPSTNTKTFSVKAPSAPTNLTAVQSGLTCTLVSWSPSSNATGYRIHYNSSGGHNGSETVSGGSTNHYQLTGLHNGANYTIFIVATSQYIPSYQVIADNIIHLVPGQSDFCVEPMATSISLYDGRSMDSVVDGYLFHWWRDTSVGCSVNHHGNITTSGTDGLYVIESLHEDSTYLITVTAINEANSSQTITAVTQEAVPGELPSVTAFKVNITSITIQWELLSCIEQNGDITGYKVTWGNNTLSVTGENTSIYAVVNLTASATYHFKVAAVNTVGTGPFKTLTATTLVAVPVLNVTSTRSTSVSISWTSAGVNVSYSLRWQRDTSVGCLDPQNGSIVVPDHSSLSYDITGLQEDSRYIINITACNLGRAYDTANTTVTAMTIKAAPSAAPPSVRGTSSAVSITVQWGSVDCFHTNGAITGYSVRYRERDNERTVEVGSVRNATISGLHPSTNYSIKVAAVNNVGTGNYSNAIFIKTNNPLSVSLVSSQTTFLTVSISLAEGVTASALYNISYININNTGCFSSSVSGITTSETEYTLSGLDEGTTHNITVTVMVTGGVTAEDSLIATTLTAVPSRSPRSVSLSVVNSTSVTVRWNSVHCRHKNGIITGYRVEYWKEGSTSRVTIHVSGDPSGGVYTISGLSNATMYSVRVAAETSAGVGVYSETVTFTTPANHIFLSLNVSVIPNNSRVVINDIGSTDNSALLCHTDLDPTGSHSGGDWFAPDNTRVHVNYVSGFVRNRTPYVVRLLRNYNDPTPPVEGIYTCNISDSSQTPRMLFVQLVTSEEGMTKEIILASLSAAKTEPTLSVTQLEEKPTLSVTQLEEKQTLNVTQLEAKPTLSVTQLEAKPTLSVTQLEAKPTLSVTQLEEKPTLSVTQLEEKQTLNVTQLEAQPTLSVTQLEAKPTLSVTQLEAKPTLSVTQLEAKPTLSVTQLEAKPTLSVTQLEAKPTVTQLETKPTLSVTQLEAKPTLNVTQLEEERTLNIMLLGPVTAGVAVGILLLFVISFALLIRWRKRNSLRVKSKPLFPLTITVGRYEVTEEDEGKEKKGIEMKTIEATDAEDNDYTEDVSDIVAGRNDILEAEFPAYVREMHQNGSKKLKQEYTALEKLKAPSSDIARLPFNLTHNRFRNIHPYDHNRVTLNGDPAVAGSDYVNASFIDRYSDKKNTFIAAQGPTDVTVSRFLEMVWQYQIPTIVMLTRCVEDGKEKCEQYWSDQLESTLKKGKFSVTLKSFLPSAEYQIRKLQLTNVHFSLSGKL